MCGIAGELLFDDAAFASVERLGRMLDAMVYRGPDDSGTHVDGPVAIGVRRLSIIDVAGGHQPIYSEDGSKAVVLNGEIYNYIELREELTARGHTFATNSDTEVIVHLYEEKGAACVNELNGMFAFALWDASERKLLLARDRLGIKPLHYHVAPDRLVFSSELTSLMACGSVPRDIDPVGVRDYFTFFYTPGDQSIYRAVRKLAPATTAVWKGNLCTENCYWQLAYRQPESVRPIEYYAEGFREQLANSVRLRLRADVPLGVFLSGGLDSGSVVAAISRVLNRPCKTFTIGFDDPSYDESAPARLTARMYGTDHHEYHIGPEDIIKSGELIPHFGEPYGPWTLVQSHLISRRSRDSVTVALAGDGGDELFGGYQTYIASRHARRYLRLPRFIRRGVFQRLARNLPVRHKLMSLDFKIREFVRGAEMFRRGRNMAWKVIFNDAERDSLFTTSFRERIGAGDPFSHVRELESRVADASDLNRAMYVDLSMFLPDCVLTCTDRMSMAASQEVRVPMLDHEMVEFAATVPDRYKASGGRTKILVRKALEDWLPEEVLNKPKTGFTTPIPMWIRGRLKDYVEDVLAPSALRRTGIINDDYVRRLLSEHISGKADHGRRIWSLVNFVLWHDACAT